MQNQSSYDKVNGKMIAPLCVLFNTRFEDDVAEAWVEELAGFSEETLMAAFKNLRKAFKRLPTLAHAIEACEALQSRESGKHARGNNPWQSLNDKRKQMIAEYIEKFKASSLWFQAVNEKWDLALWRYVHAVADVQAQMVMDLKNIGWNGSDIFGVNYHLEDDEKKAWFKNQRILCQGGIDVSIPTGRIAEWQKEAATEQGNTA